MSTISPRRARRRVPASAPISETPAGDILPGALVEEVLPEDDPAAFAALRALEAHRPRAPRPASNPALAWIGTILGAGLRADVSVSCGLLALCPENALEGSEFGFYAGCCSGRLTQLSRTLPRQTPEREAELDAAQNAICVRIRRFTAFAPGAFLCALACASPAAVGSLFACWPEQLLHVRPFYMGWAFGHWLEGEPDMCRALAHADMRGMFAQMIMRHWQGRSPSILASAADRLLSGGRP